MPLPGDYTERVYAGVLGKIIGVYLGRPFEGWPYELIMDKLGEIWYYVHEKLNVPLIVTDDDISGTFTFLRALADYPPFGDNEEPPSIARGDLAPVRRRPLLSPTPAQIGQSWLNYLIEERTVLWWGSLGNSTEHTAYLRLKSGMQAPRSGAIATNGKVVAEQIGAQIFIDGWAMVAPGDPELAADLARRAGSVSHDGEAIYGAQVLAAMEAQAFVERDTNKLLDVAVSLIPRDSIIYRMISDLRDWRAAEPDWRKTREKIVAQYGYDKYGGNCHMVPNHALIIHSLLHGDDNFQKTLMIVNTCGWDTDCNSGNVGCLMGIKNGLAGIAAGADLRGPVADRMYLPTADGGRAITDAVSEAYRVVNLGRILVGEAALLPKAGARFHFEMPGAVQGFLPEDSIAVKGAVMAENVAGHSNAGGRSLAIRYHQLAPGRAARVATPTFIPSLAVKEYFERRGYGLISSPTLYPGQTIHASVSADAGNTSPVVCGLYLRSYGADDALVISRGSQHLLGAGAYQELTWKLSDPGGPIAEVGIEITGDGGASGAVYLDFLTWDGMPDVTFTRPAFAGTMWRSAWANAVDQYEGRWAEPFRLMQNEGTGMLIQGLREWADYRVSADVTPHMVERSGIAARVQGLRRYYALLLCAGGKACLVKALDGDRVLAEVDFAWQLDATYDLALTVTGNRIRAAIDGKPLFDVVDTDQPLEGGAVALLCTEGRTATQAVRVQPA